MDANDALCMANVLKILRNMRQNTQGQIAQILHVCRSTYALYETGQRIPDHGVLSVLANYYGITVDLFYERNLNIFYQRLYFGQHYYSDSSKLVYMFRMISPYNKGKIAAYIEEMYNSELNLRM